MPLEALPTGFIVGEASVKHIEAGLGIFCSVGVEGVLGFVHISRMSDDKITTIDSNGSYRIGSMHRARVVGFSDVDGVYLLSMEESILESKFLSVGDASIGQLVTGTVDRFIKGGMFIKLSSTVTGYVPDLHIADVKLQFPEKKFKEGASVKCRVLDSDVLKKRVTLTMKKSLVNAETPIFSSYNDIASGAKSTGVIVKLYDSGALVQFYGGVHGFLPSSQMSEAYISNPKDHFKIGQTLSVTVISINAEEQKMTVSCRDSSAWDESKLDAFAQLQIGSVLAATITEKTANKLVVSLLPSGFTGTVDVAHLSDGDASKCDKALAKARVGGHLKELVVLDKQDVQKQVILSAKSSLIKAAKAGTLATDFSKFQRGQQLVGYVRKAADYGVLVGFANGLTGLCLKHNLSEEHVSMPAAMFSVGQSVSCTVTEVESAQQRFQVSIKPVTAPGRVGSQESLDAPVDKSLSSIADLMPGRVCQVRVSSIRDTQLNVLFAEGVQGRVDVSSCFDAYGSIEDASKPLKQFKQQQEITVKVIGYHDAKLHKFLPLTHRQLNNKTIFECSARPSDIAAEGVPVMDFSDVKVGELYMAFVNNINPDCLWVNLSPNVRGRVKLLDLDIDASSAQSPEAISQRYPTGSALQCRVTHLDLATKHLDLSQRAVSKSSAPITNLDSVVVGQSYPAKLTRVAESGMLAQLTDSITGRIGLTDISSEYQAKPTASFSKHQICEVVVKAVDVPNKKVALSLRQGGGPDPEIDTVADLKVGSRYRGYIRNVADTGLFVELGRNVVARVKIAEVSDAFVKDWKKLFTVDQLVSGTVTAVDIKAKRVEFSLKTRPDESGKQQQLGDLKTGQVVEATVKKIEAFGIFLSVNSTGGKVSGLCHKSEIASKPVADISKIYSVGDLVKAKVLSVDESKKRISFGLKASYFGDSGVVEDEEDEVMVEDSDAQVEEDAQDDDAEEEESGSDDQAYGDTDEVEDDDNDDEEAESSDDADGVVSQADKPAIKSVGFDFTGAEVFGDKNDESSSSEEEAAKPAKVKRVKKRHLVAASGDGSAQTPSDFEKLLQGAPDSSLVWINYMAYHMQLSEVGKAREVAERALKTIHFRREKEKLNVWMALINLENNFGSDESLMEVFKRSCQFNEPREMHARLAGAFIRSGKLDKADEIYAEMVSKFSSNLAGWIEYARFLANPDEATGKADIEAARALLPRALKSLSKKDQLSAVQKFAQIEYKLGDPERGRTLFEGLLSSHPKRLDLWNVLIDMETRQQRDPREVRKLYERLLAMPQSSRKAKSVFKKWLQFEKDFGTENDVERVKARAIEFVESH
jgi:rRNA biogenesis protein RRP5